MTKTTTPQAADVKQKIRIKLRAYDHKVIDSSAKQIVETALRYGAEVLGPVPLPTEINKYTANADNGPVIFSTYQQALKGWEP